VKETPSTAGGEFAAGVDATGGEFAAGVDATGGEFAAGVDADAGESLPPPPPPHPANAINPPTIASQPSCFTKRKKQLFILPL
jgi:hypothetical protein